MFKDVKELQQYIHVSGLLDIQLLKPYVTLALQRKIYPLVSAALLKVLQTDAPEMYKMLQSAAAHYTLACAIPFIKVHISNTGINHFQDDKMQKARWWDIRDYALSSIGIADEALSRAMEVLLDSDYQRQLPFLDRFKPLIFRSPSEFHAVYPIGYSWELFLKLIPIMQSVWTVRVKKFVNTCSMQDIKKDVKLFLRVKKAIGYYTVCDAMDGGFFVFTQQGMRMQWEELPWQRSQILSEKAQFGIRERLWGMAEDWMREAVDYLRANRDSFPCYQDKEQGQKVIEKKSGLYF